MLSRRSPLLRLESDERLVALIRAGHDGAFEILFNRYYSRLLGFCQSMLKSRQDAEDVLQEVFANAHRAMLADDRAIKVRPWLYRIARNRSLNHLRRQVPDGQDSMDIHPHANGTSTAEQVQVREELRRLLADVETLPETQRTALLLREAEQLSYDEIAAAMQATIPAVKSLLVRARMALAESSQARMLTCDEVQIELAEAAEGLGKASGPVRRHVRECEPCRAFRDQLRADSKTLSALAPVGLLALLKGGLLAKLLGGGHAAAAAGGSGAASAGAASAGAASAGAASAGAASAAGGISGGITAIGGAVGAKAAAGIATAALITAGAVEVRGMRAEQPVPRVTSAAAAPSPHPAAAPPAAVGSAELVSAPDSGHPARAQEPNGAEAPSARGENGSGEEAPDAAPSGPASHGTGTATTKAGSDGGDDGTVAGSPEKGDGVVAGPEPGDGGRDPGAAPTDPETPTDQPPGDTEPADPGPGGYPSTPTDPPADPGAPAEPAPGPPSESPRPAPTNIR